jgi:hypothetical protein
MEPISITSRGRNVPSRWLEDLRGKIREFQDSKPVRRVPRHRSGGGVLPSDEYQGGHEGFETFQQIMGRW